MQRVGVQIKKEKKSDETLDPHHAKTNNGSGK